MGVGRYLEWVVVEDRGQAQGILVLWDNRVLELIDMEKEDFSISCHFGSCEEDFVCIFIGVYRLVQSEGREDF